MVRLERPVGERAGWRACERDRPARPASSSLISRGRARRRPAGRRDRSRIATGDRACVAPGRATWARVRKPPGCPSTAAKRLSASGMRSAGVAAAIVAASSGVSGPPSAVARNARDRRSVGRVLVQPRVLAAGRRPASRPVPRSAPSRGRAGGRGQPRHVPERHDLVGVAVGEQDRAAVARDGPRRADVRDRVAARREVDAGRQPGQRIGDRVGDRQVGQAERLAGEPVGIGRRGRRHDRGDPRDPRRPARMAPIAPIEWPTTAPTVTSGRSIRASKAASASQSELAGADRQRLGASWRRGRGHRSSGSGSRRRGGRPRIGSVRSRADSQPWTRATPGPGCAATGRDEPGRQLEVAGADRGRLERQPEVGRRDRSAGAGAGSRPVPGRRARTGRPGPSGAAATAAASPARRTNPMSVGDGTSARLSSAARPVPAGPTARPTTLIRVAKRDPHVVLGVERGATPAQIKAAWRRLARRTIPT